MREANPPVRKNLGRIDSCAAQGTVSLFLRAERGQALFGDEHGAHPSPCDPRAKQLSGADRPNSDAAETCRQSPRDTVAGCDCHILGAGELEAELYEVLGQIEGAVDQLLNDEVGRPHGIKGEVIHVHREHDEGAASVCSVQHTDEQDSELASGEH